jgi:hypothetical protein
LFLTWDFASVCYLLPALCYDFSFRLSAATLSAARMKQGGHVGCGRAVGRNDSDRDHAGRPATWSKDKYEGKAG